MTADHDHTVTLEDETWIFHCKARPDSPCKATFDCGCEEYDEYRTENGHPQHTSLDGECHIGHFAADECILRDWFDDAPGPESLHGSITFPVMPIWDGGGFIFQIPTSASGGEA